MYNLYVNSNLVHFSMDNYRFNNFHTDGSCLDTIVHLDRDNSSYNYYDINQVATCFCHDNDTVVVFNRPCDATVYNNFNSFFEFQDFAAKSLTVYNKDQ